MLKSEQAKIEVQEEIDRLRNGQERALIDYRFVVSEMERLESELDPRVISAIRGGLNELSHSLYCYDQSVATLQEIIDNIDRKARVRKERSEAKKLAAASTPAAV